jgi:hypothetical protein
MLVGKLSLGIHRHLRRISSGSHGLASRKGSPDIGWFCDRGVNSLRDLGRGQQITELFNSKP